MLGAITGELLTGGVRGAMIGLVSFDDKAVSGILDPSASWAASASPELVLPIARGEVFVMGAYAGVEKV